MVENAIDIGYRQGAETTRLPVGDTENKTCIQYLLIDGKECRANKIPLFRRHTAEGIIRQIAIHLPSHSSLYLMGFHTIKAQLQWLHCRPL